MKKFYVLFLLALSFVLNAQKTFTPGIRAGVNFANLSKSMTNENYGGYYGYDEVTATKMRTDFYIGFQGNIRFSPYYAMQPEVNYSRQGTIIEGKRMLYGSSNSTSFSDELKVSYISFQFINKFYFDKFNIHVGPSVDMVVEKNFDSSSQADFGILGGLGYDIMPNFGLEARIKKGIIPIISRTNTLLQVGGYYTFKTK